MDKDFMEFMQAAGIDHELEGFIARISEDPGVFYTLTAEERIHWERRMDEVIAGFAEA